MEKTETVIALCAVGAEKVVSNELRKLADKDDRGKETPCLKVEDSLYGRVRFKADKKGLYKALIGLRAADRVLLEIASFKAADFDALFEGTAATEWERLVPKGMGLKVAKVRTNRSQLKAETSIQAIVHKAAAQRLCARYKVSRLPEPVMTRKGDGESVKIAEVRVYIEKDIVSLLVDLSGEPLFKRGYRSEGGAAPLRETTAASILLLSGWKRKFPIYDPFCGSGTILIEAAMYAWDIAPGLGRNFAIQDMLIADSKIEQQVRAEFRAKIDFDGANGVRLVRIAGSDEDLRSVSIASSNAARLRDIAEGRKPQRGIRAADKTAFGMELKVLPMAQAQSPYSDVGFLVTNPPYGKRLGDQSAAEQIYKDMAGLSQRFSGWKLAVITDHSGFESFYGKKADSCREISNGAIPSYFYQYDVL
jgi:putative N6-adenine-specific DNA methylase